MNPVCGEENHKTLLEGLWDLVSKIISKVVNRITLLRILATTIIFGSRLARFTHNYKPTYSAP